MMGVSGRGIERREDSCSNQRYSMLRNDTVSPHRPRCGLTHLSFRLKPVVTVIASLAASSLPKRVGSIGDILFMDEYQAVPIEMLEPLVPRDRSKPCKSWEVEAQARTAIGDMRGGRPGRT